MRRLFNYWIDNYFVFRTDLQRIEPGERLELPEKYSIRIIDKKDDNKTIEALGNLWERAYFHDSKNKKKRDGKSEVLFMLKHGDLCFGVFYCEELIGMEWQGGKEAIMRMDFAHLIKSEKNVCISHHLYVEPGHRGQRLQIHLATARRQFARQAGYNNSYGFVGINNIASVINSFRDNPQYKSYKTICHIKIDLPFMVFNIFPKANSKPWAECRIPTKHWQTGEQN